MGYFFEFDAANDVLRCSWEGRVTDDLLLEFYSAVRRVVVLHPSRRGIVDFSGITAFEVSADALKRLAVLPTHFEIGSTLLIVAPQDVVYGLSRLFSAHSEHTRPNLRVIRTMDEAFSLLGITSAQFSRIADG